MKHMPREVFWISHAIAYYTNASHGLPIIDEFLFLIRCLVTFLTETCNIPIMVFIVDMLCSHPVQNDQK